MAIKLKPRMKITLLLSAVLILANSVFAQDLQQVKKKDSADSFPGIRGRRGDRIFSSTECGQALRQRGHSRAEKNAPLETGLTGQQGCFQVLYPARNIYGNRRIEIVLNCSTQLTV